MIKIPSQQNVYSVNSNSDLLGNIWYTKNINFDEPGYLKLSSRAVSLINSNDDTDFNNPVSFGKISDGTLYIATTKNNYVASLQNLLPTIAEDTSFNVPALSFYSRGVWWQNKWHVTNNTNMYYKDPNSSGNWTDTGISLTTGLTHAVEVFKNRNSIVVSNGSTLKQYDSGYSDTTDLIIPSDYEIVGASYSNNNMGVITKSSSTTAGKNIEALFFVWDGASSSAGAGYPIGSDMIISIAPYKSSWVLLTRGGKLKYFNGGGFEDLATLPFNVNNLTWSNSYSLPIIGNGIVVKKDLIYINLPTLINTYGLKNNNALQNLPNGIYCYDPKVGLYHRYSPSISKLVNISVQNTGIDITNNLFTVYTGTLFDAGSEILYTSDGNEEIGGLTIGNVYYLIRISPTTFKLATTKENALNFIAIDITSTGNTINSFEQLNLKDYGNSFANTNPFGGIGLMNGNNYIYDDVIFGGTYNYKNGQGSYQYLNITNGYFKNIGYYVSAKLNSSNIEDNFQKIYVKHRPLKYDDEIIIKYKYQEVLGLPTITPQNNKNCTWVDDKTLTTTADFSEAMAYTDELECEIISGSGAGQLSQISSITYNAGTYTITLNDEIDGVSTSDTCNIIVDNWKQARTSEDIESITIDNDKGYQEFPIVASTKSIKVKVILKGVQTCIEDLQIINKIQIESV